MIKLYYILAVISTFFLFSIASTVYAVSDDTNVFLDVTNGPLPCTSCGSPTPVVITNISTIAGTTTITISWNTNLDTISTLSWGGTQLYELGSVIETVASTSHSVTLIALAPATPGLFKIISVLQGNQANSATSLNNIYVTLGIPDPPPPSVTDFDARYIVSTRSIALTWINPNITDYKLTRIVRSTNFFPNDISDGQILYEGNGVAYDDRDVLPEITYYYSAFVQDLGGNWSNPAVDSVKTPSDNLSDIPEIPDDGLPEIPAENSTTTIFDNLPAATTTPPGFENLIFTITQGGQSKVFTNGSRIILNNKDITDISIKYEGLPEVLKTIGISMHHPKDVSKIFSFLLRVDESFRRYSASVGPFLDLGEYKVSIYVLDYTYSRLVRLDGVFVVTGEKKAGVLRTQDLYSLAGSVGLVAGLVQTVIITTEVSSFYDLYLLILRFGGALLGILGVRRKHKPWGTVYDSMTKRPLDPAFVEVKELDTEGNPKSVADAITDLDGRYGFLLPSGSYRIEAGKTHYQFPSKSLEGRHRDELYDNLYFGEKITMNQGELITRNIPLDPVGYDWNEFVKNKKALFRLYSRKEKIKTIVMDGLYMFGFLFTLLASIIAPSLFNFVLLGIYVVVYIFQSYWRSVWKAITVKDSSNEPYSFAIVRVFLANLNQEVKRVVADRFGKFYLLVAPGNYYVTVDAKIADGSYRRVYRSEQMNLTKGVLAGDIIVGPIV